MRRALLAVAFTLLAAGCDNGPSEPNRTQTLAGTLARAASAGAALTMRNTGNLRVTAVDLVAVAADGTTGPATGGITFGTGMLQADSCKVSGSFGLLEDSVISLGLHKGDYCLQVTEPTVVPEGASLRYELRLEITD
jgi:hypothetical protein